MYQKFLNLCMLSSLILFAHSYDDVKQLVPQDLPNYVLDHRLVAVFVFSGECDKACADKRQLVSDAWLQSTDYMDDLVFVQVDVSTTRTGPWFADQQPLPSILYYRDGIPIVYGGDWSVDTISMWFSDNQESAVAQLTDETFEHDTQSATGATTGDWLVLFSSNDHTKCPTCSAGFTSLHTVAARLRSRFVFGHVNVDSSPNLLQRFQLDSLPVFHLFRQGYMYKFERQKKTQLSVSDQLADFLTDSYQKVEGQRVTLEPMKKPGSPSSILDMILPYVGIAAAIIVPFLIAGAVLERIAKKQKLKKRSERKKA